MQPGGKGRARSQIEFSDRLQSRVGQALAQQPYLGSIGGDHGDVTRCHTPLQEVPNLAADQGRFLPIQAALTVGLEFLVKSRSAPP